MAISSLTSTALAAEIRGCQAQLDAAVLAGDKLEAARLLPILRTLVSAVSA